MMKLYLTDYFLCESVTSVRNKILDRIVLVQEPIAIGCIATKVNRNSTAGYMKKIKFILIACLFSLNGFSQASLQKIEPVNFANVNITDEFWKPKIDKQQQKLQRLVFIKRKQQRPGLKILKELQESKGKSMKAFFMMTAMCSRRQKRWLIH